MQDGHDAERCPDVMPIAGQFEQGLGGGFHENGVYTLLVGARQRAQRLRQCENEVEVGDIEELFAAFK